MNNYSPEEIEEFDALLKNVLKIRDNIKNKVYERGAPAQKREMTMDAVQYLNNYFKVPKEIRLIHKKENNFTLKELVQGLPDLEKERTKEGL